MVINWLPNTPGPYAKLAIIIQKLLITYHLYIYIYIYIIIIIKKLKTLLTIMKKNSIIDQP
jgi:hypothetical protein